MKQISPAEIGEIMVKGPILMSGYWNRPEITKEVMSNGWFHTGDLATIDDEGFIYIVDREKNMFIRGGENIYPTEVEKILLTNPQIWDVAVYGVPDEKWGEVGKASVILKEKEVMNASEVGEFYVERLVRSKSLNILNLLINFPEQHPARSRNICCLRNPGKSRPKNREHHVLNRGKR